MSLPVLVDIPLFEGYVLHSTFRNPPYKIELQPTELLQCETSSSNFLKQYVREEYVFNRRFNQVLIGRKGEYAVAKFFRRELDNRLLRAGDGGIDVCLDDWTLQVKTVTNPTYDLIVSVNEDITADYFVLCLVEDKCVVQIKGFIDHLNFKKLSYKKEINGKHFHSCSSEHLKPIGYLKSSFYYDKFPGMFQDYVMQYANGIKFDYNLEDITENITTKKAA